MGMTEWSPWNWVIPALICQFPTYLSVFPSSVLHLFFISTVHVATDFLCLVLNKHIYFPFKKQQIFSLEALLVSIFREKSNYLKCKKSFNMSMKLRLLVWPRYIYFFSLAFEVIGTLRCTIVFCWSYHREFVRSLKTDFELIRFSYHCISQLIVIDEKESV